MAAIFVANSIKHNIAAVKEGMNICMFSKFHIESFLCALVFKL
jgi:hypothetical protein